MAMSSPLRPLVKLTLKRVTSTAYVVTNSCKTLPDKLNFLGTYVTGHWKDRQYLSVEKTKSAKIKFEYLILSSNRRLLELMKPGQGGWQRLTIGGFNISKTDPEKTWSNFPFLNLAFLIELKNGMDEMIIYVFKDSFTEARNLYKRWKNGGLDLTVREEAEKPVPPKTQAAGIRYSDGRIVYFEGGRL